MHIHHRHLGAILAEVNVVSDEPRLVRFDKVDQLSNGGLQRVERSLANLRTVDIQDQIRHVRPVTFYHD